MRKTISFVLAGVFALGLITGFGSEADAAITKEQEQLLQIARDGRKDSVSLSDLEVPDRFSGDWEGAEGCVIVHADAKIELPEADRIPAGTIARRNFTQDDADTLMQVLLKGNTLYEESGMTKRQIQDRLERYQAMQRGEIPLEGDSVTYENLPEVIERWTEYARTAPEDDAFRSPASTSFTRNNNAEEIRGRADVDGKIMHLFVSTLNDFWDHVSFYEENYGDSNGTWAQPVSLIPDDILSEPLTISISVEDALRQGNALVSELGFQQIVCDEINPVYFIAKNPHTVYSDDTLPPEYYDWTKLIIDTGYELHYVRCLNGSPIGYTPVPGTASPEDESFSGTWMYEYITLDITKDGLKCFQWFSPHTEPELLLEDAQLLPFDRIAELFSKMIMVKNNDVLYVNERNGFTTIRNYQINKAKLTLMRIRSKENVEEGLLVPVWDFWGTAHYEYDGWDNYGFTGDNVERIVLTINAVDGSVIDRELGY